MWATEEDLPEVMAFLNDHVVQSMFPLANLKNFGLNGNNPRAPDFWLARKNDKVSGVLSVTQEGMLMPQNPDLDWSEIEEAVAGKDLIGIIGPQDQARSLQTALNLQAVPTNLDHDEPQYELDLDNLTIPGGTSKIVPLEDAARDEMIAWRIAYDIEALNTPADEAVKIATRDYESYIANKSHIALIDNGVPVCTSGFNARLPDIVQIGGVFTPPDLRGRGHARRAVALHLQLAKAEGVKRATLFSANENASRAYQAIGFTYIGQWTLCLFDGKHRPNV